MRRVDSARSEDHLARGARRETPSPARIFDSNRTATLDQHARRLRVFHDSKILARRYGMQIGRGRAPAPAVFLSHLKEPASELHGAVEIRVERQAGLLRRLDENMAKWAGERAFGVIERAIGAVKAVVQALVALGLLEVGQHVVVAPAGIAELAPMIIVGRLPAHIDHGIDRARTAKEPAARPIHAPALHRRLRRGFVAPVEARA